MFTLYSYVFLPDVYIMQFVGAVPTTSTYAIQVGTYAVPVQNLMLPGTGTELNATRRKH